MRRLRTIPEVRWVPVVKRQGWVAAAASRMECAICCASSLDQALNAGVSIEIGEGGPTRARSCVWVDVSRSESGLDDGAGGFGDLLFEAVHAAHGFAGQSEKVEGYDGESLALSLDDDGAGADWETSAVEGFPELAAGGHEESDVQRCGEFRRRLLRLARSMSCRLILHEQAMPVCRRRRCHIEPRGTGDDWCCEGVRGTASYEPRCSSPISFDQAWVDLHRLGCVHRLSFHQTKTYFGCMIHGQPEQPSVPYSPYLAPQRSSFGLPKHAFRINVLAGGFGSVFGVSLSHLDRVSDWYAIRLFAFCTPS